MYQKYYTDALVLRSREIGETDRVYALYTKDFGLVWARASAVRSESSRMRYALQSYSRVNVALVKGKNGWRIAGASSTLGVQGISGEALVFSRIAELLLRLVTGEEKNEYLFDVFADAHAALMGGEKSAYATIEIICVARMLYALGYLSSEALSTALFTHTAYMETHLRETEVLREKLLSRINSALVETQL